MTDRLDLDEMDVDDAESPDSNRGDWFWHGDGDPGEEPDQGWLDAEPDATVEGGEEDDRERDAADASVETRDPDPIPGVPRSDRDRPVGIPVEGGGAGGTSTAGASDGQTAAGEPDSADAQQEPESGGARRDADSKASGPHGGTADEMTMAVTYEAAQRLAAPRQATLDARAWTDWIGIVGDVPAYEINAFQRDHGIDADFFSGAGQEPAERLADVDEHSMFFAERMVLVGVDGQEAIADRAGWEFVSLETAAEKADWDLAEPA